MSSQRLKFAYARGAKIQFRAKSWPIWYITPFPEWDDACEYRAHPTDTHLEYGPISSALRHRAIEGDFSEVQIDWFAGIVKYPIWEGMWAHFDLGDEVRWATGEPARMHLLFIAEYLADEGL